MAWIESHQSLLNHPKTIQASSLLNCDRIKLIGHLHCLWWWALDVVDIDGTFPARCTNLVVAGGAQWKGKPDSFVSSLIDSGFIDITEGGDLQLHDWYEFAGKYNAKKAANKERMQTARATHVQRTPGARAANVRSQEKIRAGLPTYLPDQPTYLPDQPVRAQHVHAVMDQACADFAAFGRVTASTARAIEEDFEDFGPEWVPKAIATARGADYVEPPPWNYVHAILERWKAQGGPDEPKAKHAAGARTGAGAGVVRRTGDALADAWEQA